MEFLQHKLAQLKATWDQMSGSGRLVLALAALLVVALMVIVAHSTGSAELTALPTHFAPDELTRASNTLTSRGITNEVRGDQIFVASDRSEALKILAGSEALPAAGTIDFAALVKDSSPWATDADKRRQWLVAVKLEMEKLMKAMPGVKDARVMINTGNENTLFRNPQGASASVTVFTKGSEPLRKSTAIAMADMVVGAVNGLTRDKVNVVDATNRVSFDLKQTTDGTGEYLPLMGQYESYFDDRIRRQFSYIAGLAVTVHCLPNLNKSRTEEHKVDATNVIVGSSTEKTETGAGSGAAGTVGVTPNTGTPNVFPASAGAGGFNKDDSTAGAPADWGRTDSFIEHALGDIKETTVSVLVPYSYFVNVEKAKATDPNAKIDDAKVQATMKTEIEKMVEHVKMMIAAKDATSVKVDSYYDFKQEKPEEESSGFKDAALGAIASYGPQAGLGLLAVLALFMVYNVVRKVQPVAPPPEAAPSAVGLNEAGLDLDSILEGVELEADTIRASKMQEQISNMIKEDPESVASLIKRWVSKE